MTLHLWHIVAAVILACLGLYIVRAFVTHAFVSKLLQVGIVVVFVLYVLQDCGLIPSVIRISP